MITVDLFEKIGTFAENKDIARDIRINLLLPALEGKQEIILDFNKVEGATQSFVHALISDLFRKYGNEILEMIQFKSCNPTIREIISIVAEYMQESD